MKQFEVVISGVSGRFADCDDVDSFKKKLYDGENFISFDDRKWKSSISYEFGKRSLPKGSGKFSQIKDFDAIVFRMNKLIAKSNDIINGKVLEPAFEALVDAGINPYTLSGSNIGVFTSYGINESDRYFYTNDADILQLMGGNKTMMANRISFTFNLRGPSFVYAGDVLGTLAAFAAGYENIAKGYVDAAIVGVCSNFLEPVMSLNFMNMNFLSADSYSRVFSSDANGFARSEGCVLFFLQRAEEAKRIYANINLCETYYSGNRNGTLIQYNEKCMSTFLENIYQKHECNFKPNDLAFVEMSACGVKKLDSIESNVVEEVFCKNRGSPLLVGSIKSNVGHTEAAAPFMSLLKGILAFETDTIAPNINLKEIDRDIKPLDRGTLQVVSTPTALPGDRIGVNAVSLSGEVGHAVLQKTVKKRNENLLDNLPRLLLICGRSEAGLISVIEQVQLKPFDPEFIALANDVFSINMPSHTYRSYTILPKPFNAVQDARITDEQSRPIWFLYTGMGSQWNCMGQGLLELPIFADAVKRCDAVLQPCGIDIYEVLTSEDPAIFDSIINSFVGIITVQIGLTEVLKAVGLHPDGIIGHSVGEIGCAYADGCLTLEEAVMSSYARGVSSIEIETVKGMMAAVGKGYNDLKDSLPENIEIACHNSSFSCTLSGPAEEVKTFITELQKQNIFAKPVNVANIAYHSKYIAPAGPALIARLQKIISSPKERSSKWISTSMHQERWNEPLAKYCSAEYLTNNLLSPVLFEEGCKHIPDNATVVEIAPHGLLQAIVKKSLPDTCLNISLTKRSATKDNLKELLSSLGQLYIGGCNINVNKLYPQVSYPVSPGTLPISSLCTWDHTALDTGNRHMVSKQRDALWDDSIHVLLSDDSEYAYLNHHKFNNETIIPSGFYIYLTWWLLSVLECKELENIPILFEEVKIHKIVKISLKKSRSFSIMIQASGYFEILSVNEGKQKKTIVATGKVSIETEEQKVLKHGQINLPTKLKVKFNGQLFFNLLAQHGYQLGECFSKVNELCYTEPEYFSTVSWNQNWVAFLDSLMKIQMLPHMQKEKVSLYPSFLRRLFIYEPQKIVQSKDSITCHYDSTDKILRCDGVEMFDLKFEPFSEKFTVQSSQESKFKAYKFVEYSNLQCQDSRSFLKVCLQIIADSLALTIKAENEKFCILRNSSSLMTIITKLVKEHAFLKTRTIFRSPQEITASTMHSSKCMLQIVDRQYFENEFIIDHSFLILILHDCQQIPCDIEKHFVEVLKQSFGSKILYLYKKKLMKDDFASPIVVENDNYFSSSNSELSDIPQNSIVVRKNIEIKDISLILNDEHKYDHRGESCQRLINCPNNFPPKPEIEGTMKITNQRIYSGSAGPALNGFHQGDDLFLNEKLSNLNLPVSVLKNGRWGFYKDVTEETIIKNNFNRVERPESFSEVSLSDEVTVQYFRPENNFATKNGDDQFIEYVGTHVSGKRLIGITSISSYEPHSQIYPNFTWTIPETWSLEDAPLVPATYSQAYNILKLKKYDQTRLTTALRDAPLETVLIHMGKEYLLTVACISVALELHATVFVAVSNTKESEAIKETFPEINEDHILCSDNCKYEIQILALTAGKGVSMVINCLPGIQNINAGLNCLTHLGILVQVDERECNDLNQLGLYPFANAVSFYVVPNKISTLFELHSKNQKLLKNSLQEGIDSGIVRPFSKIWKELEQEDELSRKLVMKNSPNSSLRTCKTEKLQFGSSYSYIIVGDEKNNRSWFTFLEWLISKGARKFILAVHNFSMSPKNSHQLNRLISQKNVTVILTTVQRIDSITNANELLDEAEKIGCLEAIFFVHTDSATKKIQNIDEALRQRNQHTYVVSLFSGGLKECETRRCNRFPAIVIHGENTEQLSTTFAYLDEILTNFDNNDSPTLYSIVDQNSVAKKEKIYFDPHNHLPTDLHKLENIGYSVTQKTNFKEMGSLSPPFKETNGVYPIFVIPAVRGDQLQPLMKKLFYPVFCATLSECSGKAIHIASDLFVELNKIQPTGPVTLIGETWSSGITIELCKLVKKSNRKCKILMIDGNPSVWKNRLLNLGPPLSTQFDVNFLKNILNIANITPESFTNLGTTFENRLENYYSGLASNNFNSNYVIKALISLRHRLLGAAEYEMSKQMWNNTILFLQQYSEDQSLKLSVTSTLIVKEENDYENFVQDADIIRTINENALFDWWDYTKVNNYSD